MEFTPMKCSVRRCETKGKVENCNKFVNWILPYDNEFDNIDELMDIMNKLNDKINTEVNETTNMSPISLFQIEKIFKTSFSTRNN